MQEGFSRGKVIHPCLDDPGNFLLYKFAMKRLRQTRYTKHRHTYGIAPGTIIALPPEIIKKEKGDPDPKMINTGILADLINRYSDNRVIAVPGGLMVNDVRIELNNGVCAFEGTKFRYTDCYSLLVELVKERALRLSRDQVKEIRTEHYKKLTDE